MNRRGFVLSFGAAATMPKSLLADSGLSPNLRALSAAVFHETGVCHRPGTKAFAFLRHVASMLDEERVHLVHYWYCQHTPDGRVFHFWCLPGVRLTFCESVWQ